MKKRISKIVCLLISACCLAFFCSCGLIIKETISYEVDGSGLADISYTNKYGGTTTVLDQTLPWYKPIYYFFDEESELETVYISVSASTPVTATVRWDR